MDDKGRANIFDIARLSGVSIGTVSRVWNGHPSVREATRRKVEEAMKQLDYRPNVMASHLGSGTSSLRTMAFILCNRSLHYSFYLDVALAVESYATAEGYSFNLSSFNYGPEDDLAGGDLPVVLRHQGLVEGAIIAGANYCNLIQRVQDMRVPIVLWGNNMLCKDAHCIEGTTTVSMDSLQGTSLVVEHLLKLGHKKFAHIGLKNHPSSPDPELRLRKVLEKHGIPLRKEAVVLLESEESKDLRSGALEAAATEAVLQLVESKVPFTAVYVPYNVAAVGVIRGLRSAGLNVPDDVSVVSSEASEMADFFDPPLTSMKVDTNQVGRAMFESLVRRIANPDAAPERAIIPMGLATRGSTAKAVAWFARKRERSRARVVTPTEALASDI